MPREVEAKTDELVEAPETCSPRLFGLIRLGQLDLLALIHVTTRIDPTGEPAMGHAAHFAGRQAYRGSGEADAAEAPPGKPNRTEKAARRPSFRRPP
jgi:hypothetical protein